MKDNTTYIAPWRYKKLNFVPNKEGNIVLISKASFGPLEVYEWGIDADNNAFERYEWLENDFYQYENYCITISKEALREQIQIVISLFQNNGLTEWTTIYEKILRSKYLEGR